MVAAGAAAAVPRSQGLGGDAIAVPTVADDDRDKDVCESGFG
jgi:hypothetical protein